MKTTFSEIAIGTEFEYTDSYFGHNYYTKIAWDDAKRSGRKHNSFYGPEEITVEDAPVSNWPVEHTSAHMATAKQIAYITDLMANYGKQYQAPADLTMAAASKLIDTIQREPSAIGLFDCGKTLSFDDSDY